MNVKRKIRLHPNERGLSVEGATWTLSIRRVKTKENKTVYIMKPLEAKYNPKTHTFTYQEIRHGIWLNRQEIDELITKLIQIVEADIAETIKETTEGETKNEKPTDQTGTTNP
ncbi:MAG: hypothetical protein QXH20_02435 [Candidatus Bathyarchaeia archaeon]